MNTTAVSPEVATLRVSQTRYELFEKIVEVAGLNNGYYSHLEQNEQCRSFVLGPISSDKEEEVVLYYEGENQVIPGGKDFYSYIADKGYEVIPDTHPSLLSNSMKELTEEKLAKLGIPHYVDIVLPTGEKSLLPGGGGFRCFLMVGRGGGGRRLDLVDFDGEWHGLCAFLLRKKRT